MANVSEKVHKAYPASQEPPYDCIKCEKPIKHVPGGQGMTWVHTDTGAVAGANGKGHPYLVKIELFIPDATDHQDAIVKSSDVLTQGNPSFEVIDLQTWQHVFHPDG